MNQLYLTVNAWIVSGTSIAMLGCFLWGVISVLFSPCHLASIPLIVAYVGGQNELIKGKKAFIYATLFTAGMFSTIALVGIICMTLGRMLGDIGPWWTILVGLILIWVALGMFGISQCSVSGGLVNKFKLKGLTGALILGLAYGMLSGSCTFGFIAPILAIITVQEKIATGILYITLFGVGHCLPIVLAGSSTAWVKRMLTNKSINQASRLVRTVAGIFIALLGIYFIAKPFVL